MATNKIKRKPTKTQENSGSISITGGMSGIGNVVGHGSSSNVTISNAEKDAISSPRSFLHKKKRQVTIWVRLVAFLLALVGTLTSIAFFMRLLVSVDVVSVVELVLVAIVAALGISGTIKPQAVVDLFSKLAGKG
jgi:hypothetical protein